MRITIFAAFLLFCSSSFAYDISDFVRDAKAHHEQKLGETNGLKLQIEGTVSEPGHDTFVIEADYYTRGKRWRTDAMLKDSSGKDGFPITVLFDGQQAWATILGMKLKVPQSDVNDRVRGYLYWEEPAAGSILSGDETVNGRACWVISTPLRESDNTPVMMKSWYDKESFVLVKSETSYDKKPIQMEFSDFREVADGYVIPHSMIAMQENAQVVSARIVNAETGKSFADAMFDAAKLQGSDFPDMSELMRTMQIFGKAFANEMGKLLKPN
jgi:hypothetical protein